MPRTAIPIALFAALAAPATAQEEPDMEMRRLACSSLLLNNSGSFSDTPLCHEQYHAGTTLPVSMDRFIRVTGNLDAAIVHRHVPRHFPRSTELLESAI